MNAVVLVGLMGAGKSTVGARVATQTHRSFVDVDVAISDRTGKTVRELWQEGGESAYRHLESQVVLDALADTGPVVVAAPGGVVLDPAVRAALAHSFVVWLRADPSRLAARVQPGDHRPLLDADPLPMLMQMARDRAQLYAEVADLVIDTEDRDAVDVANVVLSALRALPRPA